MSNCIYQGKNAYLDQKLQDWEKDNADFPETLTSMIKKISNKYPDKGIYHVKTRENKDFFQSYSDLYNKSKKIAKVLYQKGIKPGDRLILINDDEHLFLNLFWGCLLSNIIPSPLPAIRTDDINSLEAQKLISVQRLLNCHVICDSKNDQFYQFINEILQGENIKIFSADEIISEAVVTEVSDDDIYDAKPGDMAVIQFSSGSTGIPKGVQLTHANMIANIKAKLAQENGSDRDVFFYWIPYFHDFGLFGCHLVAMAGGMVQIKMRPLDFARRPILWLEKMTEYKATISASTNTGIEFTGNVLKMRKNRGYNIDLTNLRTMSIGSEMISVRAAKDFINLLTPYNIKDNVLMFGYGLTETVLGATALPLGTKIKYKVIDRDKFIQDKKAVYMQEGDENTVMFADVGYPLIYSDIRIVDENKNELGADQVGVIEISGDNVTSGYYNNPEENDRVFNGKWFSTGDLGFMDSEGSLCIVGRSKEMLIINGQNYYPYDLEELIYEMSGDNFRLLIICGVYDNSVNREKVLLFYVRNSKVKQENIYPLLVDINKKINKLAGFPIDHFIPITMAQVPRTSSGKISRKVLTENYLMNDYKIIIDEIEDQMKPFIKDEIDYASIDHRGVIKKIWQEELRKTEEEINEINLNANLFNIGCDSIMMAKIQGSFESFYKVKLETGFCYRYPSMQSQIDYFNNRDFTKEPPQTELEDILQSIVAKVYNTEKDQLGVTDNIITRSGNFMEVQKVLNKIDIAFELGNDKEELFQYNNIRDIAEYLDKKIFKKHGSDESGNNAFSLMNFQETLYFHRKGFMKNEPSGLSCFIFLSVKMIGPMNHDKLDEAFNIVIKSHPMLRAVINEEETRPRLEITEEVKPFECSYFDISEMNSNDQETFLTNKEIENNDFRFDITQYPMFFAEVYKLDFQTHVIMIDLEHIIIDGYSTMTFMEEVFFTYDALISGKQVEVPEMKLEFKDYVEIEKIRQRTDEYKQAMDFQLDIFHDLPGKITLPFKKNPAMIEEIFFDTYFTKVSPELINSLKNISEKNNIALNSILLAAYFKIMNIWAGQDDLIINMPIFNREHYFPGARRVIGSFIDIFPVRIKTKPVENLLDIAVKCENYIREMLKTPVSSIELSRLIAEKLDHNAGSLSNIIFSNSFGVYGGELSKLESIKINDASFRTGAPGTYIDLVLYDYEGVYSINWNYIRGLFEENYIETLAWQFQKILEEFSKEFSKESTPELFSFEGLMPANQKEIIAKVNDTGKNVPVLTLNQWIEKQVEKTPDNIAMTYENESITYLEMNKKANMLAGLLRDKGLKPGGYAALLLKRRIDMVIAQIAVWKAGAAYLPIDPEYPVDRIQYVLDDSGSNVLIIQNDSITTLEKLNVSGLGNIVILDNDNYQPVTNDINVYNMNDIVKYPASNIEQVNTPGDIAYLIYTSGSTGKPKGTMVTHENFCNFIYWVQQEFKVDENERFAFVTSYSFDMTLTSNWCPFISGAVLHILSDEQTKDAEKLIEFISEKQITFLNVTPSHFSLISNARVYYNKNYPMVNGMKVMLGGEMINVKDLNLWLEAYPDHNFINEYGPTEATVASSFFPIPKNENNQIELSVIPIGKAIYNTQHYILNEEKEQCMIGVKGDLYIAGKGVSRGYLNKPEKTAEAFVKNIFSDDTDELMYFTGDKARFLEDGNIEFLGREDHQLNLRGYRIECGEIEKAIVDFPSVKEAVVDVREDKKGNKTLVAFYTAIEKEIKQFDFKNYIGSKLPEYMIPSYFHYMDHLPVTASGKLNKKLLPVVEIDASQMSNSNYKPAETETEKQIAGIWEEVLGVKNPGILDKFWDLGGDSLSAMRLINKMKESGYSGFSLKDVFNLQTIQDVVNYIEKENLHV